MFSSVGLIGMAILLAFAGTLVAALYAMFVLGLAGMPGAFLTEALSRNGEKRTISTLGLLLTILGQVYASLAFVALIVQSVRSWIGNTTGIGKWILWIVAFCVAVAPAWMALKDSNAKWKEKFEGLSPGKIVPYYAATFTAPITIIGFLAFALISACYLMGLGMDTTFLKADGNA
ncbi:MAG: hypothetical protein KatS3mg081_2158 [Gemmatimonadales bacterium]|nr:MAG: hypothetical protein KatS3mg081_2158 [Gemmatimonadales bacterium]